MLTIFPLTVARNFNVLSLSYYVGIQGSDGEEDEGESGIEGADGQAGEGQEPPENIRKHGKEVKQGKGFIRGFC